MTSDGFQKQLDTVTNDVLAAMRDEIKRLREDRDLFYGEATRANARENDAIKRAEAAEAKLALVDTFAQWKRNAPKGSLTFAEWLARREDVQTRR